MTKGCILADTRNSDCAQNVRMQIMRIHYEWYYAEEEKTA